MTLRKLIHDLFQEGGSGFYTQDSTNRERMFEICPEKILMLDCMGPSEMDIAQQSFHVTRYGCVGGRKHNPEDSCNSKDIVLFKDITVSRRHFEVKRRHLLVFNYCVILLFTRIFILLR